MQRLERSVVFALLLPALRLAESCGVRAKDLERWVRVGYFKLLRDDGRTVGEAASVLGVSEPTANRIARELRSDFLTPWVEHELPKQIVLALWQRPRSLAKLQQLFPQSSPEELEVALATLEEQGRIRRTGDHAYETCHPEDRLVGPDVHARLGGLQSLLQGLTQLVQCRIFATDPRAFVRTVTFRVPQDGDAQLEAFYRETVWPFLKALENQAASEGSGRRKSFSLFWSPAEGDSEEKKE